MVIDSILCFHPISRTWLITQINLIGNNQVC